MKIGLVLEGGGMRGLYTIGVLDYFMENNIQTNYCIGVSAGACSGVSYVSQQVGRSKRINLDYINDPKYVSLNNFIKTKSLFGMDFIFDEIPNKLDPFDYDTFLSSPCEFVTGVTDITTGKPVYFTKDHLKNNYTVLRASSSIPMFSPIVEYKGGKYLDGGTSDPIPVKKALSDGCEKIIVILTRHRGFIKPKEKFRKVYIRKFKKYPNMISLLDTRHIHYNDTLNYLNDLEKKGTALVVAPSSEISISRFEKNRDNLENLYNLGYNDAKSLYSKLLDFLK